MSKPDPFVNAVLWIIWGVCVLSVEMHLDPTILQHPPEVVAGKMIGGGAFYFLAGLVLVKMFVKDKQSLLQTFSLYFGALFVLAFFQYFGKISHPISN